MESSEQYPIMEIFDSIQGEGSWLGIPATFIRFAGCNLRCEWCDTKNSWQQGSMMTVEAILDQVYKSSIIITGGEPTLCELGPLIDALRAREKVKIAIETNGTNPINVELDWIVCSPKPDADYVINCEPNELKYVVDTTFTLDVIPERYRGVIPIWLQPNSEDLENSMAKCYELVMANNFLRLGIQLHKIYQIR